MFSKSISLLALVLISGCSESARKFKYQPPMPTIAVNSKDTLSDVWIKITYSNHKNDHDITGLFYIELKNPSDVALYKKEVKFLMEKLEETEKKFVAREIGTKPAQGTNQ